MPRPRRAHGRPGTRVIPTAWSTDHASVATKSMNATCQILPPGEGPLVFDPDEGVSKRGEVIPSYDGPCRIQKLNAQDGNSVVGGQSQTTVAYLLTLTTELLDEETGIPQADSVTGAHRVRVITNPNGPSLVGELLFISSISAGSERFEVDLFCVEDQSEPTK